MATTFEHTQSPQKAGSFLKRLLRSFWRGLIRLGERHPALVRIKQLEQLDDAELARRGIRRDEIAMVVLRRYGAF